jgi:hypothetical protein
MGERKFEFTPVQELRPALKEERSLSIPIKSIPVSPVQMQKLQERRTHARELGWTIPGHTIRIRD